MTIRMLLLIVLVQCMMNASTYAGSEADRTIPHGAAQKRAEQGAYLLIQGIGVEIADSQVRSVTQVVEEVVLLSGDAPEPNFEWNRGTPRPAIRKVCVQKGKKYADRLVVDVDRERAKVTLREPDDSTTIVLTIATGMQTNTLVTLEPSGVILNARIQAAGQRSLKVNPDGSVTIWGKDISEPVTIPSMNAEKEKIR